MRLVLLVLALSVSACSLSGEATDNGAVDPADLAGIDLRPGSSQHTVPAGSADLTFILDVPQNTGSGRVPLVIAMPYAGDPGPTAQQYYDVLARPGLAGLGTVVVVPVAFDPTWDTPRAVAVVSSFVEAAVEAWPVDPARVVVTGYSNGGNGAWAQAAARPDLYSAAVPMGSYPPDRPPTAVPLYVIHGEADELFPVGRVRAAARSVESRGGRVRLEVLPFSHFEAGRYAAALARALAYVEAEVWPSSAP